MCSENPDSSLTRFSSLVHVVINTVTKSAMALKSFLARAEGPAVNSPARQGGVFVGSRHEGRRPGTAVVSHLRRSILTDVQSRPHGRAYSLSAFQASTSRPRTKLRYR